MNNNDRKDFFYGAGLDENNNQGMMNNNMGMNQQPMMNNNMGMNQQPMMNNNMGMNQQPMMNNGMGMNQQPMMNNNMGMNQQPMMNNNMGMNQQPMMNNNMGMNQQPMMNNGMGMNQQPMMNNNMGMNQPQNNMGGYHMPTPSAGGGKINIAALLRDKRIIGIAVGVVAVIFILVFFVFHKTLKCTAEEEIAGVKMEMTQSVEYWFGKPTKLKSRSVVDLSDVDEDQRESMIEYYEEAAEEADEDQHLKVKVSGDKVIITSSEKIDEDDMDDYDDAKDSAEDAGFTCK